MSGDQVRIEKIEDGAVACLDDGGRHVVRADHAQTFDLAIGDVTGRLGESVTTHEWIAVERENV